MALGEGCGGRAVRVALGDEGAPRPPRPVVDDGRRLVAAAPTCLDEAPDRVDVLAEAQRPLEPVDRPQCIGAHEDGRRRHVAQPRAWSDAAWLGSEVERRVPLLVGGDGAGTGRAGDAWCDEADAVVGEVQQQRVEPTRHEADVGVDEGDQWRRRRSQSGVASDGGAGVGAQAQHPCAGDRAHRWVRGIVDGDHGGDARAAADDLRQRGLTEHERRHDDRHVGCGVRRRRWTRVDRPGLEQTLDEAVVGDVLAGGDACVHADAGSGQPEQPQRRPSDHDVAARRPPRRRVQRVPRHPADRTNASSSRVCAIEYVVPARPAPRIRCGSTYSAGISGSPTRGGRRGCGRRRRGGRARRARGWCGGGRRR